jgi:hypothetical protein
MNNKGKFMENLPKKDCENISDFMNSHSNLRETDSSQMMYSYNIMRTTNNRIIEPVAPLPRRRVRNLEREFAEMSQNSIDISVMIPVSSIESDEDESDGSITEVEEEQEQEQQDEEYGEI